MKVQLVDFSGVFRRFWHASEGEEVNIAKRKSLGFIRALLNNSDHTVVCIDKPPYNRSKIRPEYKAHREKAPQVMYEEMRACLKAMEDEGIRIVGADGFEADDIIGTVCGWCVGKGYEVLVHSSDKDLMQLVQPTVSVQSVATGEVYDEAAVLAKFGVPPASVCDVLALAGDKSDGIAGIAGVGFKTAAKWVSEFGDLAGVLSNLISLPDRFLLKMNTSEARKHLLENWELVMLQEVDLDMDEVMKPGKVAAPEDLVQVVIEEDEESQPLPAPKAAEQSRSIAVRQPQEQIQPVSWDKMLEPKSSAQAWGLAKALHESRIFGDWPTPGSILAAIMTGRSFGMDSVASLRGFHVIQGKSAPSSQLLIGLVKKHPDIEYMQMVESSEKSATWVAKRKGEPKETTMTFTIEQAKAAGYLRSGSLWSKDPATMLVWRAGVRLARIVAPDVTSGLYSAEEMQDT